MILNANALALPLASNSVQCVVTSPPYWGLRDYGVKGQLGTEPTPDEYIVKLVSVFREVWRVLRDDGVLWLNLGDTYSGGGRGGNGDTITGRGKNASQCSHYVPDNLKAKNLIGIPWRVALALQADGWYLRSDIIWHKPNPLPESVADRPTKAHEYVFLLAKQERYFYDAEAIKEISSGQTGSAVNFKRASKEDLCPGQSRTQHREERRATEDSGYRNRRSVWTIPSQPTKEAHFATYPEKLVEPCILAGTSEKGCCPRCGRAWVRVVEKNFIPQSDIKNPDKLLRSSGKGMDETNGWAGFRRGSVDANTTGWRPACTCNAGDPIPCLVHDPFSGSGTTARVAIRFNRRFVGTELKFQYISEISTKRLSEVQRVIEGL
jgi:DNA modification methylase